MEPEEDLGQESVQPSTHIAERAAALARAQGARIRDLRKAKRMTIEAVASKAGLHFNTVGRIERGATASLEQQLAIADALGVDAAELNAVGSPSQSELAPHAQSFDEEAYALVEMLDVRVSGGMGAVNAGAESVGRFAFSRSWLKLKGLKPSDARIVKVRGRSMADRINDGDILLVDVSCKTLDREGVYVIELNGEDYVKVLQRDFVTGGIRILSYNAEFAPQVLSPDQAKDLRITGRAVWHAGEL